MRIEPIILRKDRILSEIYKIIDNESICKIENFVEKIRYRSDNTVCSYLYDILTGLRFFKSKDQLVQWSFLYHLDNVTFRSFCAARKVNLQTSSQQRMIISWKLFYKSNDMTNLSNFSIPKLQKKQARPIDMQSIQTFFKQDLKTWLDYRNYALFMLLYGTGLRISEALQIDTSQINQNTLQIKGKGGKYRLVPLLDHIKVNIITYLKLRPYDNNKIFVSKTGKPLSQQTASHIFRRIKNKYNFPPRITLHSLRHSFATHLLKNGCDIRVLQALLGHANISTTAQYIDIQNDALAEDFMCKMSKIDSEK